MLVVFAAVDLDVGVIGLDPGLVAVIPTDDLERRAWPSTLPHEARLEVSLAVPEPMLSPPDRRELAETIPEDQVDEFLEPIRAPGPLHQLRSRIQNSTSTAPDTVTLRRGARPRQLMLSTRRGWTHPPRRAPRRDDVRWGTVNGRTIRSRSRANSCAPFGTTRVAAEDRRERPDDRNRRLDRDSCPGAP